MFGDVNPLLTLSMILLIGFVGGRVARRFGLPGVTGQILAGVLIGHSGFDLFAGAVLENMGVLTDFALAFIAVSVGSHLQFRRLHNAGTRLFLLLLTESTITPLVTFVIVITMGGADWELGLLLAAMAISTAPATILALVRETRSKGVFVKTLIAAVALNNVACIVMFEVARAITRPGPTAAGAHPALMLLAAVALGIATGGVLVYGTRHIAQRTRLATISLIGVLAVAGIAAQLELSPMLACLVMGSTLANLAPRRKRLGVEHFEVLDGAIFAVFFTLAGAHLDFHHLAEAGMLAMALLLGRITGKMLAADLAMRLAEATEGVRRALGRALIPQAGVAVGLILIITRDPAFVSMHHTLLAVGLTTVMINELVGPVFTRRGLAESGDMGRDRRRVIDFIQEEHITVDLRAATLDDAIAELSDLLIQTDRLDVDRDRFIETVRAREAEGSTCVGGGLAVPHARLEGRNEIAGAIGISRAGLTDPTPDDEPVHIVVLLATSDALNDRHLEVLSALAQAMIGHEDFSYRLWHARTPAHVYDMLHCEEADDFNSFLDPDDDDAVEVDH